MKKIKRFLLGKPLNPFNRKHRKHITLIVFLAWIALGADGLSSSCYGPEQAFLALGNKPHLALYLAIAIAFTVFLISRAYSQVIALFPNGGGGYKVASELLGPYLGVVAGVALLIDYILTIAISLASAIDAVFSFLPKAALSFKLEVDILFLVLLTLLNLRGVKESIKILLPIFLGFFLIHIGLIVYGIFSHGAQLPVMFKQTIAETHESAMSIGWFGVIALLFRAYSMGGGIYTGLEAVSNNVSVLAEPRVTTGKWTMFYMALSLSLMAGGIILLYLLWNVEPVFGKTLNAVVFEKILGDSVSGHILLIITLLFEGGILFVGANTGFLGGPAVLSNMAIDSWVPARFRHLSSRLVSQNGIIFFGVSAALILLGTDAHVATLVVMYSINVFLAFAISLLALCVYWVSQCRKRESWKRGLSLSAVGFLVCSSILITTVIMRFTSGGFMALLISGALIFVCYNIKKQYIKFDEKIKKVDEILTLKIAKSGKVVPELQPDEPTAVIVVERLGSSMHSILKILQYFPGRFKNFVFISVGAVDVDRFRSQRKLEILKKQVDKRLKYLVKFMNSKGFAATSYMEFGTDPVDKLEKLSLQVKKEFSDCMFFATHYILRNATWFASRILYHELPVVLQRRLQFSGNNMLILPMCIE